MALETWQSHGSQDEEKLPLCLKLTCWSLERKIFTADRLTRGRDNFQVQSHQLTASEHLPVFVGIRLINRTDSIKSFESSFEACESTAQRHCLETQSVCSQHSSCMVVRFAARGDILFPRFCGRRSQLAFCG
ncbi:hypothetical protein J6590_076285 [Homalodisca vitripennis]|nr:hypothetical protein J6590_076285 [Homalodisca vitripennis]